MAQMNKSIADALCAMIAIGYIKEYERKTTFVCSGTTTGLKGIIGNTAFEEKTDKPMMPFIVAKPKSSLNPAEAVSITDRLKSVINKFEETLNAAEPMALPGAYIGGILKNDGQELRLFGASELYLYQRPSYVEARDETVNTSYNNAKKVTQAIINFLNKNHDYEYTVGTSSKITVSNEIEIPPPTNFVPGNLFASCHGLVTSMIKAPVLQNDYNVELAAGAATGKVASCIPCSLFAASTGNVPTATHLGCGDNWNFPKSGDRGYKTDWAKVVIDCYGKGSSLLSNAGVTNAINTLKSFQCENPTVSTIEKIPDLFLYALTFEDSFINRINNTLGLG